MTVIQNNNKFHIEQGQIKTYDKLPTGTYSVEQHPTGDLYLALHENLKTDCKIYGKFSAKVSKVFDSYSTYPKSMGVLLAGSKGTGKTLFAKKICEFAIEQQMPVILVNQPFGKLADFIDNIKQEVVILFDEFDKTMLIQTFRGSSCDSSLLTLLDGTSMNKKLFIFTVNDVKLIGNNLLNRPGRIHYRFDFTIPDIADINEYLQDEINDDKQIVIPEILNMSVRIPLNYDTLRAIAFEVNNGNSLEDTLYDLNINYSSILIYHVEIYLIDDFNTLTNDKVKINFDDENIEFISGYGYNSEQYRVYMNLKNIKTDIENEALIVSGDDIKIICTETSKHFPKAHFAKLKLTNKAEC